MADRVGYLDGLPAVLGCRLPRSKVRVGFRDAAQAGRLHVARSQVTVDRECLLEEVNGQHGGLFGAVTDVSHDTQCFLVTVDRLGQLARVLVTQAGSDEGRAFEVRGAGRPG